MSMRIVDNFELHDAAPLDSRLVCNSKSDLDVIKVSDNAYPLMQVACLEDSNIYTLSKDMTKWSTSTISIKSTTVSGTVSSEGNIATSVSNIIGATLVSKEVTKSTLDDNFKVTTSPVTETFYATPYVIGTTWYLHIANNNNVYTGHVDINVYYIG